MKYIFTDVDGVLNNAHFKGVRNGFCCLDNDNLHIYAEFVRWCYEQFGKDNVKTVLTSSWRGSNIGNDCTRKFLDDYLDTQEDLRIDDETERCEDGRGIEIVKYLNKNRDCDGYVVFDDVQWDDFKPLRITSHLVQTSDEPQNGKGGLRERHIKRAKEIISRSM